MNDLYVCSPYFSSLCQGVSTKTSASRLSSCEKLRQGFQQVLRVSGMGTDLNRAHDFTTLTPLVAFWHQSQGQLWYWQRRRLPPCPLAIALVPLKCLKVEIYNFPIGCPFLKEKMPWCLCPLNKMIQAYMVVPRRLMECCICFAHSCRADMRYINV